MRNPLPEITDRLKAPSSLPKGAAGIWREIVDALAADHFGPQDRHHLAAYCHAAWRHDREVARDKRRMGASDPVVIADQIRIMARLGPQLRLVPSSRIEPRTAASSNRRAATELRPSSASQAGPDWRSELH